MKEDWVEEDFRGHLKMKYKITERLYHKKTEFQTVEVVNTVGFGKMLLNDSLVMVTEKDEFVYHDMITHVPLFLHPNPKKVLIIGGGDGGTAREVLRHKNIERCVMVEIDGAVVDSCKEFIHQTSCALDDSRLELIIGDGVDYVDKCEEKFDVVLVDSTEPIGPATPLFGDKFYLDVAKVLVEDGIVVAQGESPFYNLEMQKKLTEIMSDKFKYVSPYNYSNLTYPGGAWSFIMGSKKYHPTKDLDHAKVGRSGMDFNYYNEDVHVGAFAVLNFVKKELGLNIKM